MKSLMTTAALTAVGIALPSMSLAQQAASPTGVYGNLGYANASQDGVDLGAIQGRLGYRFNNYLGAEGELAVGVKGDKLAIAPGLDAHVKLRHQEAIYGVGFLPLSPKFDLLGRVGYGGSTVRASTAGLHSTDSSNSWNFGAGGQYHFDGQNGVRADFTRAEFIGHGEGHANVWSVAYSRRF